MEKLLVVSSSDLWQLSQKYISIAFSKECLYCRKDYSPEVADRYRSIASTFIAIINEGFEWISFKFRFLVVLGRKLGLFKSPFLFFENKCIFHILLVLVCMEAKESEYFQTLLQTCPEFCSQCSSQKYSFGIYWNFELPLFDDFCPDMWNIPLQIMGKQTNCNYSHRRVKSSEIWQVVDVYRVYYDI